MADYHQAIRSYVIVLDTNVLLQLYRFTPSARKELLDVLDGVRERVWIPHQVAVEFYDRRIEALKEHIDLYNKTPQNLAALQNKALEEIYAFTKRCSISSGEKEGMIGPINDAFQKIISAISRHGENFDLTLEAVVNHDPVLEHVARILDGRVGAPFSKADRAAALKEYASRAAERIPPGYKDSSKSDNAHGDYFLWEQTLREAESRRKPVLLVTNDEKEDWVRKEAGLNVGARPELIQEMSDRASVDFLLTPLSFFLRNAKQVLGAQVSESTVAQAELNREEPDAAALEVYLDALISYIDYYGRDPDHYRLSQYLQGRGVTVNTSHLRRVWPQLQQRYAAFERA